MMDRLLFLRKKFDRRYIEALHLTSDDFVRYARACLNLDTVYFWGGLGEVITGRLLSMHAAQYPASFKEERVNHLRNYVDRGVRGFDCSGLLKRFVMGGLERYVYLPERDLNCAALLERSGNKGPMDTLPQIPGICLYMEGHTGIYIGDNLVVEATPNKLFGDGVVTTSLSDREWTSWYEMPWIDYRHQEISCGR